MKYNFAPNIKNAQRFKCFVFSEIFSRFLSASLYILKKIALLCKLSNFEHLTEREFSNLAINSFFILLEITPVTIECDKPEKTTNFLTVISSYEIFHSGKFTKNTWLLDL